MKLRQRNKVNETVGASSSFAYVPRGRSDIHNSSDTGVLEDSNLADYQDSGSDYQISEDEIQLIKTQKKRASRSTAVSQQPSKQKRTSRKARTDLPPSKAGTPTGVQRPTNRRNYALPLWSSDHRHKSAPFYRHQRHVERLAGPPNLFGPAQVVVADNWTSNTSLTSKIGRISTLNVGCGPVWELMEDRSWWKESVLTHGREDKEHNRRPRVYQSLDLNDYAWEILDPMTAVTYQPGEQSTSQARGNSSISCFVGPLGHQQKVKLSLFESCSLAQYIDESRSHLFNAGTSIWGLDWCPIGNEDLPYRNYKQYLAVAPYPSPNHSVFVGRKRSSPACIQIWSLSAYNASSVIPENDPGKMNCELIVCIENGPACEIKWCPLPSNDSWDNNQIACDRKLGILAGAFEDGSMCIYAIPDPQDLAGTGSERGPLFVKPTRPLLRVSFVDAACCCLDWANSEVIAVGCSNGAVAVYNISSMLKSADRAMQVEPTHYLSIHQSAIRTVQWIRVPPVSADGNPQETRDPCIIFSGGYDGAEVLTDIRESSGNVINRTRDVINCSSFSHYTGGVVCFDQENIVKTYNVTPALLGRGHSLLETNGPIWSIDCSDYHAQVAIGCADGGLLTVNSLKSTRRSESAAYFVHKIYHLDFNRNTGEHRILEQFLPEETQERPSNAKQTHDASLKSSSALWPTAVSVQRVSWNSGGGLARAPLLASGTGSGLCRVDWVLGRLLKGRKGTVISGRMPKDVDEDEDEISINSQSDESG